MDLLQILMNTKPQGPHGILRRGDASESVQHFVAFGELAPEDQALVNEVWRGDRQRCLVPSADGCRWHYIRSSPSGAWRGGHQYGYLVRSVECWEPKAPPRTSVWLWLCLTLLVMMAGAGSGWFSWSLAREEIRAEEQRLLNVEHVAAEQHAAVALQRQQHLVALGELDERFVQINSLLQEMEIHLTISAQLQLAGEEKHESFPESLKVPEVSGHP
jgi:hypothetical protein